MSAGVVATVFALIGVGELCDKTMIANLVMGSRGRPLLVWLGSAAAFALHVALAVGAGRAIELLPHTALEVVVTALFFLGAALLLVIPERKEQARGEAAANRAAPAAPDATGSAGSAGSAVSPRSLGRPWKIAGAAFVVVLVGEFGDLTQILILNFVGKYHQPLAVAVGAYGGLLAASAAGAFGGRALLRVLPLEWIRRMGGVALLGFAAYGIYALVA